MCLERIEFSYLEYLFIFPTENGCQEHYEPAGDICIRESIYPESYESAQTRRQSEGGYLLSITSPEIQVTNNWKLNKSITSNSEPA